MGMVSLLVGGNCIVSCRATYRLYVADQARPKDGSGID